VTLLPVAPALPITNGHRPSTQGCVAGRPPSIGWTYPVVAVPPHGAAAHEVALTFDDGPSPTATPQILAALRQAGAQATFFVIGTHVHAFPDLVRRELAAGNAVGNHTFDHPVLGRLNWFSVGSELQRGTDAVTDALGNRCVWLFRPPYGAPSWNAVVAGRVRQAGLVPVLWDVDAADWQRPGAAIIAARIVARLRPGAIILLHDGAPDNEIQDRSQTAAAVPLILAALRARGLHAVTLPQLLLDAGVAQSAPAPPTVPSTSTHEPE
jgi:peptidoglycan/xylan/chitin deacetylase (PgdA/CDA1 family)